MSIGKNIPTGGKKVIYDYSNRLVKDDCQITIAYAAYLSSTGKTIKQKLKSVAKYLYACIFLRKTGYTWYNKNKGVEEIFLWKPIFNKLPESDVYLATSLNTAQYVADFPVDSSKKFYFIQGYESFVVNDDNYIKYTYRLPLQKIVVAKWLYQLVTQECQRCILIPNGFDLNEYKIIIPIEKKDKYLVSMLYHVDLLKDTNVGIDAVKIAKNQIPDLRLVLFGAYPKPSNLPEWVTYYQNPSPQTHLDINNHAAIYVASSRIEGWGLTIGEAMLCGQAVACTDNLGYKEMATHNYNAMMTPVGDILALADSIISLVKDEKLRYRLAKKGNETIQEFNIENSYRMFYEVLKCPK
jgi:glycosyltransferase involved in cell wall biosynthesis